MSILIPGTEKLAETVDIAVKWGSPGLTGKLVPAGTPLTAAGEVATVSESRAAAVRGITAIDYGYSPYSNSCPCIVAGVVDMTKVKFGLSRNTICAALDQISFIDANKKVYHPSVASQIEDGAITADKLAPGVIPDGFYFTLYEGYWEDGELLRGPAQGVFLVPSNLETGLWADMMSLLTNPWVGNPPARLFSLDEDGNVVVRDCGLYYQSPEGPVRMTDESDLYYAGNVEYIYAEDPPEPGE